MESAPKVAVRNSKGKAVGKLGEIGKFLLGAVERMKLGHFEISESSEGDFLIYQLRGAAAEALQAGDGRATDALQLVANQVAMRQSEEAPRIVVDVEGGGDEREDTLQRLAERAVKRALDTGRSVALDPMNSRDRRTIHLAIRDEDDVATMSIGEGRYRQVLVVPEGAPEYDDAVEESSRS
jgi:spoIIIJ-associated protein